jgi:mRNA interferase MazF
LNQFDIWWVNLDPAMGTETQKDRPCVLLSSSLLNARLPRVAVAPLLKGSKPFHFVVNLEPDSDNALDQPRYIDLTQLRFVDKSRLRRQNGRVRNETARQKLESAIGLVFSQAL